MSSLSPDRATNLREAYRICTPEPFMSTDLEKYYVDLSSIRNTETIQNITTKLEFLEPAEFCTILFTGHRGCGKSTELRKLQKQLEAKFYIVYLQVDSELDINDVEYTDLYLLIIKKNADQLYKLGASFDRQLLASFELWFKEITKEIGDRNGEAKAWFNLGITYKNLQQNSEAKTAYENARSLDRAMKLDKEVKDCDKAIQNLQ
jgi:energy-coupling factor transporter ATP-binding protein EcfA2